MNWFLYDRDLRHKSLELKLELVFHKCSTEMFFWKFLESFQENIHNWVKFL